MQIPSTIALSRLMAQQRALDVVAGNIANASTTGYKAERTLFADWIVRERGTAGPPGAGSIAYTQDRSTWRDMSQGALSHTGNPFDLALTDEGYFTVATPAGTRLTRSGRFGLMPDGTVADSEGNALLDISGRAVQLGSADTTISIAGDGTISSENGPIGQIAVVRPSDSAELQAEGSGRFSTDAPTTPVAAPKIVQGAIEESNVQPVMELTRMMTMLREFQFATQFVDGEIHPGPERDRQDPDAPQLNPIITIPPRNPPCGHSTSPAPACRRNRPTSKSFPTISPT